MPQSMMETVGIDEVLARLEGVTKSGDQWGARCPAHEDRDASLSIAVGDDGRILLKCHAGCEFPGIVHSLGFVVAQLRGSSQNVYHAHINNGHNRGNGAKICRSDGFDSAEAAIYALSNSVKQGGRQPDHQYPYTDSHGVQVGYVCRWNIPAADGQKTEKIIRPVAVVDGRWVIGGMPRPHFLYCLPEVVSAKEVFVVEGEKAADALRGIGIVATTSPHGAKSADKADWSPLAGKTITIWPDNDENGIDFCGDVIDILKKLTPQPTVRVYRPDGMRLKDDAFDWIEQRDAQTPDELRELLLAEVTPIKPVVAPVPVFALSFIDSAKFAATNYHQHYLIKRALVGNQPCILGGGQKTLKTTIAIDAAFSLGTGTRFLNEFEVPEPVRVGIISGESGAFTIKETATRIAHSRGQILSNANIWWCFKLPQLGIQEHLDILAEAIEEARLKVCVIDPAYLSMLVKDDGSVINFSNLFEVGSVLLRVSEMFTEIGCTPIIIHHESKGAQSARRAEGFTPPELTDLSQSGFAEWARQWLLIGRREQFEHGSGIHRLWLNAGGSAGHGGLWAIDVDEGHLEDDFTGRIWKVSVSSGSDCRERRKAQLAKRKEEERLARIKGYAEKIVTVLRLFPDGATKSRIAGAAGLNSGNCGDGLAILLSTAQIEPCNVTAKNNRTDPGYRLKGPNSDKSDNPDKEPGQSLSGTDTRTQTTLPL